MEIMNIKKFPLNHTRDYPYSLELTAVCSPYYYLLPSNNFMNYEISYMKETR